jgi:hypothetical protein
MQDQVNATPAPKRVPWNKGKLTGAKPPLRPKHVWSIRTKLQIEGLVLASPPSTPTRRPFSLSMLSMDEPGGAMTSATTWLMTTTA